MSHTRQNCHRLYTLQTMIDFTPPNKLAPQRGRILISYPYLDDPFFKRTVVLLCEHNDEGSFGFVLNKYIDVQLDELIEDLPRFDGRIALGGPVQTSNLFYLHTLGDTLAGSAEVMKGLYMGGDYEALREAMSTRKLSPDDIRFFVGYSGWSEGQLEEELKENAWLISETEASLVMDTETDKLWQDVLRRMGSPYRVLSNMPEDPSLN